ncbi:MAG: hypothetical protein FWB84_07965 [Candidatus Bathyarchaeota archaeon]|uniref:CU044_2847 family protein n=1 Tax=Candidatus Bathycorpusculum sp. TaxID=2994959 RepID=UPI00282F7250|nr:hypothetical protein [Candidatus Termiticorpusculum sp.]MCL2257757.1 hypothetical protein [Candidatus Termiticorpusculum sp.]MCL2292110.1 hypothetical protein [Candidatus Termiticorpusculum sp.]
MVKKTVKMDLTDGNCLYFQTDVSEEEGRLLGGLGDLTSSITTFGIEQLEKSVVAMCSCIDSISNSCKNSLDKTKYSNIEVEFGLSVDLEGRLVIVNASAEANIKIKVTLKGEQ